MESSPRVSPVGIPFCRVNSVRNLAIASLMLFLFLFTAMFWSQQLSDALIVDVLGTTELVQSSESIDMSAQRREPAVAAAIVHSSSSVITDGDSALAGSAAAAMRVQQLDPTTLPTTVTFATAINCPNLETDRQQTLERTKPINNAGFRIFSGYALQSHRQDAVTLIVIVSLPVWQFPNSGNAYENRPVVTMQLRIIGRFYKEGTNESKPIDVARALRRPTYASNEVLFLEASMRSSTAAGIKLEFNASIACELPLPCLKDESGSYGLTVTSEATAQITSFPLTERKTVSSYQGLPRLAICYGPIFSVGKNAAYFFSYWMELIAFQRFIGVHEMVFYVKSSQVLKSDQFAAFKERVEREGPSAGGHVTIVDYSSAPDDGNYHNQFEIMNDCLFRVKNGVEYILFWDIDEVLWLNNSTVSTQTADAKGPMHVSAMLQDLQRLQASRNDTGTKFYFRQGDDTVLHRHVCDLGANETLAEASSRISGSYNKTIVFASPYFVTNATVRRHPLARQKVMVVAEACTCISVHDVCGRQSESKVNLVDVGFQKLHLRGVAFDPHLACRMSASDWRVSPVDNNGEIKRDMHFSSLPLWLAFSASSQNQP